MKYNDILRKFKNGEIGVEDTLQSLANLGHAPNLLNDDNGHWALSFDGFQNVPKGEDPEDMNIATFVEASDWKDTIYDAMLHALEKS